MSESKENVKEITEEDKETIAGWFASAKVQTCETLPEFIRHLMHDYRHDYSRYSSSLVNSIHSPFLSFPKYP